MSRLQWCFQAVSATAAFLLAGSVVAAPVVAARGTIDAPDKEGSTALLVAVMQDQLDAAKHLLSQGAKADATNRYRVTPLYAATLHGNTDIMAALLAAKADPNGAAPSGETLLMTSARAGVVKAMQLLINAGAKVDAREPAFNQTALMLAARSNSAEATALLL